MELLRRLHDALDETALDMEVLCIALPLTE